MWQENSSQYFSLYHMHPFQYYILTNFTSCYKFQLKNSFKGSGI